MKETASRTVLALFTFVAAVGPLYAQTIDPRQAIGAAIASDIVRSRQADRDASRYPYASPGYGPIGSASVARDACAAKALYQAGPDGKLIGRPRASTMSTGWEVEGEIGFTDGGPPLPFICSVRNGSVSGVALQR